MLRYIVSFRLHCVQIVYVYTYFRYVRHANGLYGRVIRLARLSSDMICIHQTG